MASTYFENLNYTLANEDARFESAILPMDTNHVVAVGGSGARVIPLLSKKPKRVSIVDISEAQLALCELRIEALRNFSHEQYLQFWGYPGPSKISQDNRKQQFQSLNLTAKTRSHLSQIFESVQWNELILNGKWERTFLFFSKISKLILGSKALEKLFSHDQNSTQQEYLKNSFSRLRWNLLLSVIGNARTFNTFLYRGQFPEKNIGKSFLQYYQEAFDRLFAQGPVRNNFFLQLCLLGELRHASGLPAEVDPVIFDQAKKNISDIQIEFVKEDLVAWVSRQSGVNFISFSNVPSYFTGALESNFLQDMKSGLAHGARVVVRNYLHHPENLKTTGYREKSHEFKTEIAAERMQMYDIEIWERET